MKMPCHDGTVFSFEGVIDDHVVGDGGIVLAALDEDWPGYIDVEEGGECDQGGAQDGEVGVKVGVFGAGFVFAEDGIADPVVAAFGTRPVSADEPGEALGRSEGGRQAADVEGGGGLAALVRGAFAAHHHEAAGKGQIGLCGLEGVDLYGAFVEASVAALGFFGVGKRGVLWDWRWAR